MVITLVSLGLEPSLACKPRQLSRTAPLPSKCQQSKGLLSNNFSEKSD